MVSQFASWPLALWFKYRNGLLTWQSERIWLPALALGLLAGQLFNLSIGTLLG